MKSQLKIKEVEEFPKLMVSRSTGIVVLFNNERCGMVVYVPRDSVEMVGRYTTEWVLGTFTPYTGKVTLEN